ncbi:hypothetical protein D3C73_657530 [compost metagenome]
MVQLGILAVHVIANRATGETADCGTDQGIAALVAAADDETAECADTGTDCGAARSVGNLLLARIRIGRGAGRKEGRGQRDNGKFLEHSNRFPS